MEEGKAGLSQGLLPYKSKWELPLGRTQSFFVAFCAIMYWPRNCLLFPPRRTPCCTLRPSEEEAGGEGGGRGNKLTP